MDLQGDIESLRRQLDEIANSDLSPGVKNDVQGILKEILARAEAIKPLYDNIEAVRDTIVSPTNERIRESFDDYSTKTAKTNRRNVALSIIGILFGVIGVVLTVLQIRPGVIPPFNHAVAQSSASAQFGSQITKTISEFSWVPTVNYPSPTAGVDNLYGFSLTDSDNVLVLSLSRSYGSSGELSNTTMKSLENAVRNYFLSSQSSSITPDSLKLLSATYDSKIGSNVIRFATPANSQQVPQLWYQSDSNAATLVLPRKYAIDQLSPIKASDFGPNPAGLVLDASTLLRHISGRKYVFNLDRTLSLDPSMTNYDHKFQHIAIFTWSGGK